MHTKEILLIKRKLWLMTLMNISVLFPEISKEIKTLKDRLEFQIDAYEKDGNIKQAFESQKQYIKLKDELLEQESLLDVYEKTKISTYDELNKYFTISEMPVISSRYWNMVHGNTPEEVKKDGEGLYTMRVLGKNMAYYLKCQEAARKAGIPLPEPEKPVFTNFINE